MHHHHQYLHVSSATKYHSKNRNTSTSFLCTYDYTGMTSIFDESSHLRTIPSRLAGKMNFAHWHPVVNGSGGGTIISTLSFLWTTPITLTVLPSFMYLHFILTTTNYSESSLCLIITIMLSILFGHRIHIIIYYWTTVTGKVELKQSRPLQTVACQRKEDPV